LNDPFPRLRDALADRYRLERELGHGGMATVYLAHDLKHDRDVAIKVLKPDLAALLGPERFLREIATTARLSHPGILPLFDSGTAAGSCWYAMPYFTGKTLKDRLAEQGRLPLPEALAVFRDLAGALDHAHRQGILHRDLKPANVLLQDGRAVLADFGIALPVGQSVERLTETGFSLGTPEYMSPEQVMAEPGIDGRSDIYALGCVLYQLLAGEPPFTGPTPRAVLARRLRDPVPRLSAGRDVPPPVEAAIRRALEREPKDRFATVADFARAVEGTDAPPRFLAPLRRIRSRPAAATLLVAALGVVALRTRHHAAPTFNPNLVAVLPARIVAPGHALDYLREGILDLAAAKLTGEGGPRAVDARATLAALRSAGEDSAGTLAARLGAGKLLDASIVGDGHRLTVTASLISYPGGTRQAPVSVDGPEDSLGSLVDRLMIRVMALHAGVHGSALTDVTSLPAWRAYLRGKAAYRTGQYVAAAAAYEEALAADSNFTLAALADHAALVRSGRDGSASAMMVYRNIRRLSPDDSLYFFANTGPHFPADSKITEQIDLHLRAMARLSDRADAWFELGDMVLHAGAMVDIDSSLDFAAHNFERALALDSSFALPIDHLLFVAYARNDAAAVRRLMRLYEASDSLGDRMGFYRWRSAVALGDSAGAARERARFPTLPSQALDQIVGMPQSDGVGVEEAVLADSILGARAVTEQERAAAHYNHALLMLNLGRPTDPPIAFAGAPIDNALFTDGDTVLAAAAARLIRQAGPLRARAPTPDDWMSRWELACWELAHGNPDAARPVPAELRAHRPTPDALGAFVGDTILVPLVLDAWLAVGDRSPGAGRLVGEVDSVLATGQTSFFQDVSSLLLGRMFTALGQPARALRALRRTPFYQLQPYSVAAIRLARARAAVAAGRREEAIRAYEVYLGLRRNPAPRLVPQRDSARAELAALVSR
jgi:eukaryotic-like serine/threonine-protein kinase